MKICNIIPHVTFHSQNCRCCYRSKIRREMDFILSHFVNKYSYPGNSNVTWLRRAYNIDSHSNFNGSVFWCDFSSTHSSSCCLGSSKRTRQAWIISTRWRASIKLEFQFLNSKELIVVNALVPFRSETFHHFIFRDGFYRFGHGRLCSIYGELFQSFGVFYLWVL